MVNKGDIPMQIVFHSRNGNLADDFRGIAKEKLETLTRFGVQLDEVKVEIKHEQNPRHGNNSHEVILSVHGSGPFMRAEGSAFNDVAAFDKAVENLESQLRKQHDREKDHARDTHRNHVVNE
jgi:ribosomal subunit interface protein